MTQKREKMNYIFYIVMGCFFIFTIGFVDNFLSLLFFGVGGIAMIIHGIKGLKKLKNHTD